MRTAPEHSGDQDQGGDLVFVYNVDGTPVAFLRDAYLGLTTGSTDCHLCDLTFGRILKDKEWAAVSYTHLTLPTICSV